MALTPTPTQDLTELIVMDSGLSSDLFCKLDWLQDLRQATRPISMETNAGSLMVDQEATLPDHGTVMVNQKAITNVMSLAMTSDKCRIAMDTAVTMLS